MDWGQGRYERIAEQLFPAAEVVVESAGLTADERVVDVGCGTGNAALLAAERGASVTGVDPAQRLLDVAAASATERGLNATFLPGDAADMPLDDDSADVVLSVFGVTFAPDPQAAAAEIERISASEARLLLTAWIPEGPIFQAVRLARQTMTEILDQPPDAPSFPWHEGEALSGLFEPWGFSVSITEHSLAFAASSVDEFMQIEGENHPVAIAAQPVLESAGRADEVRDGMRRIYEEANEDPREFQLTSRYVVAEMERNP